MASREILTGVLVWLPAIRDQWFVSKPKLTSATGGAVAGKGRNQCCGSGMLGQIPAANASAHKDHAEDR